MAARLEASRGGRWLVPMVRRWSRELWREWWRIGNPFATRDARSRVRGIRFPVLLLLYQIAVVGVGLIAVLAYASRRQYSIVPAGSFVFPSIAYIQIVLTPVVAGILTATVVSGERERQTIDLVLLTTLRGLQVVLGKVLIPWGLTMLVALTSLPYSVLCLVGGGLSGITVWYLYAGVALFAGIAAAFGILMSVVSRTSTSAVVVTAGTYVVALIVGMIATLWIYQAQSLPPGAASTVPSSVRLNVPYLYTLPTTWVTASLLPTVPSCTVFTWSVPFWLPAVVLGGGLIAYCLFAAGCAVNLTPLWHLSVRRILGLLTWAVAWLILLGGAQPDLSGAITGLNAAGYSDGRLGLFLLVAGVAAGVGALAASLCGSVESPHLLRVSPARVFVRLLAPQSALCPMGEGGMWTGLVAWAIPIAALGVGFTVLDGDLIPRGMPEWIPSVVLASGALFVIYGALVGLWAGANYRVRASSRRAVALVVVVPLAFLPLVALVGVNMAASVSWAPLRTALEAIIGLIGGLSPIGVPTFVGHTGLTDPVSSALRVNVGPGWVHPYGVAAVVSIVLPFAQACLLWRAWRRNAQALGPATKPAPKGSIIDGSNAAGE